jgi:hypothetical protein
MPLADSGGPSWKLKSGNRKNEELDSSYFAFVEFGFARVACFSE